MEISNLFEDLRDFLRPLQGRLFPRQLLLELRDDGLRAQVLADGRPGSIRFDAPLPPLTSRNGMPLEREPIGDMIGDLMVRDNLMEAFVMAALPPAATQWRVFEWPRGQMIPDDPLEAIRSLNPKGLRLPFPLEEAVIDVRPLPGIPSMAMLAASSLRLVEAWIQVFNHAGAQLERLAPAQSCEYLGLRSNFSDAGSRDLVALLSPDGGALRLLLVRDGIPRFDRTIQEVAHQRVDEVVRSIEFYRRSDPEVRRLRLIQSSPLPDGEAVAAALQVPLETPELEFDSLVISGLAIAEATA